MLRNVLIGSLARGEMLIASASAFGGYSRKRAACRGVAALATAAALLVALGGGPASATPPDACHRTLNDGDEINEVKGSEIKNLTVCWWRKSNGTFDMTYTGTIEDTAADGARARVIGRTNFGGDPSDQSGTVLMQAVGKGTERNFGRAAGGGIVRGVNNFNLRLQTYDKSKGKVKYSSFWLTFP